MADFSNFTTLLQQSMNVTAGQAAAIANSPVSPGSSLTWGQLFASTMDNPAHVPGAANIYYSGTVTLNGVPTGALAAANQIAQQVARIERSEIRDASKSKREVA